MRLVTLDICMINMQTLWFLVRPTALSAETVSDVLLAVLAVVQRVRYPSQVSSILRISCGS